MVAVVNRNVGGLLVIEWKIKGMMDGNEGETDISALVEGVDSICIQSSKVRA